MRLYTIYDKVTEVSGPLFEAHNDADAIRAFKKVITADQKDYELYAMGNFDRNTLDINFYREQLHFELTPNAQLNLL